jgi:hypothetical protein
MIIILAPGLDDKTGFGFARSEFFLIIMTQFMIKLIQDYGRLLAIDATHNTTPYGFKLITVMVVDPQTNSGYPVAFCIAPSENERCVRALFMTLKVCQPENIVYLKRKLTHHHHQFRLRFQTYGPGFCFRTMTLRPGMSQAMSSLIL